MKTLFHFLSVFKRTLVISLFTLFPLSSFASFGPSHTCPSLPVRMKIKLMWDGRGSYSRFYASTDLTSLKVASTHSTRKFPHNRHSWGYQVKDSSSGAKFSYELTLYRSESKKLQKAYKHPHLSGAMSILDCNGNVIATVQDKVIRVRHKHQRKVFHITVRDKNGNKIGSGNYQYNHKTFALMNKVRLLLSAQSFIYSFHSTWIIKIDDPHFDPRIALALGYYVHERQKFHVFY